MPTIIALDVSLSMQRAIPGRSDENPLTFHQLALKGITQFLEYLSHNSKLEHVSLVTYSTLCEIKVDFTRDYDQVRQLLKKLEAVDKICLVNMLKSVSCIISTTWGVHTPANIVVFSDCGLGFGSTALNTFLHKYVGNKHEPEFNWVSTLKNVKFNFICLGLNGDSYFAHALTQYQQLFNCTKIRATLIRTRPSKDAIDLPEHVHNSNNTCTVLTANPGVSFHSSHKNELGRTAMSEMIEQLCEVSFKPYEAVLKCGGSRLETSVILWPSPQLHEEEGKEPRTISNKLEICGFLSLADIGSPASLSRHVILPKSETPREKQNTRRTTDKSAKSAKSNTDSTNSINYEFEKLELEIREANIALKDNEDSGDDVDSSTTKPAAALTIAEPLKENACVMLHNSLKMENLAGLVLLGKNWYGFVYACSDAKKKSNLMLNILPPGNNIIPWLGDFSMLGFPEDMMHNDVLTFPIKAEKRSYSQNQVVWIKYPSVQADVQKVLRHAKKIPEKTQHFYKELNRIRRYAISIGYLEMLEALAKLFESEALHYAHMNTHSESALQLKHAAIELRKPANLDLKISILPLQKYAAPPGGGGSGGNVIESNVQASVSLLPTSGFKGF